MRLDISVRIARGSKGKARVRLSVLDLQEGKFMLSMSLQFPIEVVFLLRALYIFLTLFDSGASHSFISSDLVDSLHLSTSLVNDPMCVSNPIGGSAHLSII